MHNVKTKDDAKQLSEVTDLVQLAMMREMRQKIQNPQR